MSRAAQPAGCRLIRPVSAPPRPARRRMGDALRPLQSSRAVASGKSGFIPREFISCRIATLQFGLFMEFLFLNISKYCQDWGGERAPVGYFNVEGYQFPCPETLSFSSLSSFTVPLGLRSQSRSFYYSL